ncbi:hypothetical protein [Mycobacteroides salmoniphilum]|uniref:Uncharacterized protein n=1 Tax=Mycobacteroides salmoniphilum TaxID=404941 RepID=A0A4R8SV09_9MYCO|nr:hypothetical protein [Mycobacteroides salmoniphilum]TEA06100.1 hypothetical protein CCUG60884_01237 [Mycobacteroides salmoniphilum]
MSDDWSPRRRWTEIWLWVVAVFVAAAVLAVAVSGRDRGTGPTLRPMSVSESMSDEQARAVAESTVLVWVRELRAGHLANLRALTNPENADDIMQVMEGRDEVVAFGGFARRGPIWSLNTHLKGGAAGVFILQVKDGELRVDRLASAAIP